MEEFGCELQYRLLNAQEMDMSPVQGRYQKGISTAFWGHPCYGYKSGRELRGEWEVMVYFCEVVVHALRLIRQGMIRMGKSEAALKKKC